MDNLYLSPPNLGGIFIGVTLRLENLPYTFRIQYEVRVPYLPTPLNVVEVMLKLANPKPGELLVDLGSGDGRILIYAAKKYGCYCRGYEINPVLVFLSRRRVYEEGLADRVEIINGDFRDAKIDDADIITAFLSDEAMRILKPKFEREAKDGCRIVSHDFPIPDWRPVRVVEIEGSKAHTHRVYLYVVRKF